MLLKPYLVSEIQTADGKTVSKTEKTEVRQVISKETSKEVLKMMNYVVEHGTGQNGKVPGYNVSGKTGTSEKIGDYKEGEKKKYAVSFSAIAPTENPRVAMIIICDEPNQDVGGGVICAPVAAAVVEETMKQMGIEPSYTESEAKELAVRVPSVTGKKVETAKSTIKLLGLEVTIKGNGKKVVKQSPTSDNEIPKNGKVVLYTEDKAEETVKVPNFEGLSIAEANRVAASYNLNIKITGNDSSSANVVAYKQSEKRGTKVGIGTVITVSFKSNHATLD